MSLESSVDYIDDLNEAWPDGADQKNQGDNHIRNIKKAIKASFPNVDGPVTATDTQLNNVVDISDSTDTAKGDALIAGKITGGNAFTLHDYHENRMPDPITDFGAVGNGTNDDTSALNAWLTHLRQNKLVGYWPPGEYRVTDELQFYGGGSTDQWGIVGSGRQTTRILYDFADATKAVIQFEFGGRANNRERMRFSGFSVRRHSSQTSNVSPVGMDLGGIGNSHFEDISFHQVYNTCIRADDLDNPDFRNVECWNCGISFMYKDTDGITFSNSGTTLTASSAIFDSDDAADSIKFTIDGSGYTGGVGLIDASINETFTIATYNSTTEVVLSSAPDSNYSGISGTFEAALGSGTAAGTTLTANAACFESAHVGLKIWIAGAGTGGVVSAHTISSYTDTSNVEVTPAFTSTFSLQEFAVCVVDIDASGNIANDVTFDGLHIELFSGVGIGLQDTTEIRMTDCKVHGYQLSDASNISTAYMWLRDAGLVSSDMLFDSNYRGGFGIRSFDQNLETAKFSNSYMVLGKGQHFAKNESYSNNGRLWFDGITIRSKYATATTVNTDNNSPSKTVLSGWDNVRDTQANIEIVGQAIQNGINRASFYYDEGTYTPSIRDMTGNSNSLTPKTLRWAKVGRSLTVYINFIQDIDTTGLTAGEDIAITLPYTTTGHSFCGVLLETVGGTGPYYLYSVSGTNYAKIKDSTNTNLLVSDFTSGATDIIGGTLTIDHND